MAQPYQIVITPRAEASLESIIDYLRDTASDEAAEKVRDSIEEAIRGLAEMPQSHGLLRELSDSQVVFRRVLVWSYRIIYTIKETELLVLVVEIDHAKRNPQRIKDLLGD